MHILANLVLKLEFFGKDSTKMLQNSAKDLYIFGKYAIVSSIRRSPIELQNLDFIEYSSFS